MLTTRATAENTPPCRPRINQISERRKQRHQIGGMSATGQGLPLRQVGSIASFRHGGFTEAGDAELTDAEMRAQGRHKSAKVLTRYAKRSMRQVAKGIQKRHAERTKKRTDFRNEQQQQFRN